MNKVNIIIPVLFIILFSLSVTGQENDVFVNVGDTNVNLKDVSIEKGYRVKSSDMKRLRLLDDPNNTVLERAVFKSPDNYYYAVVCDTTKVMENSFEEVHSSSLRFFDHDGNLLFNKHYKNAAINNCYILTESGLVFAEVVGLEQENIRIYDRNGRLLMSKSMKNTSISSSYLNKILAIQTKDEKPGRSIVDFYINGSLYSKQLTFDGEKPIITFSSNEEIISIRHSDKYLLYDLELSLVKTISSIDNVIYVFNNGKSYFIQEKGGNTLCDIRDINTDTQLLLIDSVHFKDGKKAVYITGVVNHGVDIYVAAFFNGTLVFNFYDITGNFINTDYIKRFRGMNGVDFERVDNGYKILLDYEY